MSGNGIRRKLVAAKATQAPAKGADGAWKLALARAARHAISLDLTVDGMRQHRRSLTELLEMPPERALIGILEGPKEGLGIIALDAEVLAGLIEHQTLGRVTQGLASPRKPTRTDAAMVSGLIDRALRGLEEGLEQDADLIWAGGFRYASFMEDPRPLGLLLEDAMYRILHVDVSLAQGAKTGQILLALPADGRGTRPAAAAPGDDRGADLVFRAAMGEQVMTSDAVLQAVLARVTMPLQAILALKPGDPVLLGSAALTRIDLEGVDGCRVGGGKLGQNRGMRAVRFHAEAEPAARGPIKPPRSDAGSASEEPLRAAG